MKELLHSAIIAGISASIEVMNYYTNGFTTEYKEDLSPVTNADIASNNIITESFSHLNIPILSEEGIHFSKTNRNNWEKYWIIDPIDGTKGFVDKTDEFAVCIGLIEAKKAKLGVIAVPAKNVFYFGGENIGAFKFALDFKNWEKYKEMSTLDEIINHSISIPLNNKSNSYIFLRSKDYLDSSTQEYINNLKTKHPNLKEHVVGSALKFGLLAEGFANEYTRLSTLNHWDIAAGDAIIKSAGKKIISSENKKEIIYNNQEIKIKGFYAF